MPNVHLVWVYHTNAFFCLPPHHTRAHARHVRRCQGLGLIRTSVRNDDESRASYQRAQTDTAASERRHFRDDDDLSDDRPTILPRPGRGALICT